MGSHGTADSLTINCQIAEFFLASECFEKGLDIMYALSSYLFDFIMYNNMGLTSEAMKLVFYICVSMY